MWANQVSYALEAKLQAYSFFTGMVNSATYGLAEFSGNQYLRTQDYASDKDLQLHYMTTPKAVKQANPGQYAAGEFVGDLPGYLANAKTVLSALDNKYGKEALKALWGYLKNDYAKDKGSDWILPIVDWILEQAQ